MFSVAVKLVAIVTVACSRKGAIYRKGIIVIIIIIINSIDKAASPYSRLLLMIFYTKCLLAQQCSSPCTEL